MYMYMLEIVHTDEAYERMCTRACEVVQNLKPEMFERVDRTCSDAFPIVPYIRLYIVCLYSTC